VFRIRYMMCSNSFFLELRKVLGCFPLQTIAFRGHGFSLLEKTALRCLQTRAVPAGVNGLPLQTTIIVVVITLIKEKL